MIQSAITALPVCVCGGAIWVRRTTWRIRWDRALTMSALFQGLGFALCAPAMSHYLGRALFRITGVAHLHDFFGHVLFICAICCVIYACACRLVADEELEDLLHKIEFPGSLAGGTMLAAITLSHNTSGNAPADFFDVRCDFWLYIYWLSYGAIIIYLLCFLVRLLWVVRPRPALACHRKPVHQRHRVRAGIFRRAAQQDHQPGTCCQRLDLDTFVYEWGVGRVRGGLVMAGKDAPAHG